MKFELGQVAVTPRAAAALAQWGQSADDLLARHAAGDWGDLTDEERRLNDEGIAGSLALVSSYITPAGERLMVFTKADRSCTLVHVDPRGSYEPVGGQMLRHTPLPR